MTAPFLGTNQVGSFPAAGVRPRQRKNVIFTTSGFWTVPLNVYSISLVMAGGGGGGGGGGGASYDGVNTWNAAGGGSGGGAAATLIVKNIDVIPSTVFLLTIGAGGTGGAAGINGGPGASGANGNSGGTTSITGYRYNFAVTGGLGGTGGSYLGNGASFVGAPATSSITSSYTSLYSILYTNGSTGGNGGTAPNGESSTLAPGFPAPDFQYAPGGSGGTSFAGLGYRGGSGGGGGSNLFSRGGAGGAGALATSSLVFTQLQSASAGKSPSELYVGYLGYGAGGGGGGGGAANFGYIVNYNQPILSGSAGGNGGSGFIEITWEE